MDVEEKRLYPRLSLKIEDGYFGHFKMVNNESLSVLIVSLSAGGISTAVTEKEAVSAKIKEGDTLLLRNIAGGASMAFLNDIKSEIRWIKKLDVPNYLSVGVRFKDLSDGLRQQLSRFVDSERMTRGQYTK